MDCPYSLRTTTRKLSASRAMYCFAHLSRGAALLKPPRSKSTQNTLPHADNGSNITGINH